MADPVAYDVFISYKSEDLVHGQVVYRFLVNNGVSAFFAPVSLPAMGGSEFRRSIDQALDQSIHLILVTSSAAHTTSPWVEHEWGAFIGEKRSGRKTGNLITLTAGQVPVADLPLSLRSMEVLPLNQSNLQTILNYVRVADSAPKPAKNPAPQTVSAAATTLPPIAQPNRAGRSQWDYFNASVKAVIHFAKEEAALRCMNTVSTEDLLLGMTRIEDCGAVRIMGSRGVTVHSIATETYKLAPKSDFSFDGELLLSQQSHAALNAAYNESRTFADRCVGTEHLLIGILSHVGGPAFATLSKFYINVQVVRFEMQKLRKGGGPRSFPFPY